MGEYLIPLWSVTLGGRPTVPYAFDPELAAWAPRLPVFDLADILAVRAASANMARIGPAYRVPADLAVTDRRIPGPDGAPEVPVRVYRPAGLPPAAPALLYLHGGGFVMGSVELDHRSAAELARKVGALVISVDYRLAPEHPFPAGLNDCYAALRWAADNAEDLGLDRDRLGVAGESAGGGLAAALALLARDAGGPAIRFQFLGIPELDDRLATPSMRAFTDTPFWSQAQARWSWSYYLHGWPAGRPAPTGSPASPVPAASSERAGIASGGGPGSGQEGGPGGGGRSVSAGGAGGHGAPLVHRPAGQPYLVRLEGAEAGEGGVSPYAAPARAEDLTGLPPAFVVTCEFDPLRDEGIGYAQRLIQAGVTTELHHYPGTFHNSTVVASAAVSRRMIVDRNAALARGLGLAAA